MGREEKGEGGDRGDLMEKKESPKEERAVEPIKMDTEDWVLKGTKLITNTKKQRLKFQSRGWIFKNTILKKRRRRKKKVTKVIKIYIYIKFALKKSVLKINSRL